MTSQHIKYNSKPLDVVQSLYTPKILVVIIVLMKFVDQDIIESSSFLYIYTYICIYGKKNIVLVPRVDSDK